MNKDKILNFLDSASKAYYAGSPIIDDNVFDALADAVGYNKVGARQHDDEYPHAFPLLSQQKHYAEDGENPLSKLGFKDKDLVRSYKLDGAAISLLYIDGEFCRALTRGDGKVGTDITNKFLGSRLIPAKISAHGVVQIVGEVVAPSTVPNSRNYAAGSLNLKDVEEFKTRAVSFFAYDMLPYGDKRSYSDILHELQGFGFSVVTEPHLDKIYPCDGLIYRVDDLKTYTELGFTAKHPRGAYAFKEKGEAVETTLVDVVWQVGKSGKVTPVGILEPVMVGDAIVSRATLNNQAFIQALDLHIGDRVAIQRAGEIIPQVLYKVE